MRRPSAAPYRQFRALCRPSGLASHYGSILRLLVPMLILAFAWLAPASRAATAACPVIPPSHAGFPTTLTGAGTALVSQPVIADLGLTPGFAQIIFGTTTGQLYVLQHNSNGSWSAAPG